MSVDLIVLTNGQANGLMVQNYQSISLVSPSSVVRMDNNVAFTIQPILPAPAGSATLYQPDVVAGDVVSLAVGNYDQPATGGTFNIALNAVVPAGLNALPFNETAANLQTAFSAAMITNGQPGCLATELTVGTFRLVGATNGAITTGYVTIDPTDLDPTCSWSVFEESLGSADTPYVLLLVMRQAPVIYANPTTPLPATGVSVSSIQYGANGSLISGITIAAVAVVTTTLPHGLTNGQTVLISGSNSTPSIDGLQSATVLTGTTFSVPVTTTGAGTTGAIIGQDQIQQAQFTQDDTYGGSITVTVTAQNPSPVTINSTTVSATTLVTTATAHGLTAGQKIWIAGDNSIPSIDGFQTVLAVGSSTTFTLNFNVTTGGNAGTVAGILTRTCGLASPQLSNSQFGNLLANHPYISYVAGAQSGNNIIPTKIGQAFQIEFTGTLGNSAIPSLSCANVNLVGPQGFSGVLDSNTIELYEYSLGQGSSFSLPISILRTRTSGESRTIWYGSLTIQKDNLNLSSAVNVSLPSCLVYNPATGVLINPTALSFFNNNTVPQLIAWMEGLPSSLPATANQPWMNGRSLSLS